MRRAAALCALLLAGCPIPQPLPDYPAGTITPPRILTDGLLGTGAAVTLVPANCATEPVVPLRVTVLDTNTSEGIEARWFVNYDSRFLLNYRPVDTNAVNPDPSSLVLTRFVPPNRSDGTADPFLFQPYQHREAPGSPPVAGTQAPYGDSGILRVVDLVVSNGFDPAADTTSYPYPYRTALAGFETQTHRWVFLTSTAVPCPP